MRFRCVVVPEYRFTMFIAVVVVDNIRLCTSTIVAFHFRCCSIVFGHHFGACDNLCYHTFTPVYMILFVNSKSLSCANNANSDQCISEFHRIDTLSAQKTKFIPVKIEFCSRITKFHFYSACVKMEDIQTFQHRRYNRADPLKKPSISRQLKLILEIIPSILPKTLIIVLLTIYSMICLAFRLIIPRRLKNIQGHLAAVSGISNESRHAHKSFFVVVANLQYNTQRQHIVSLAFKAFCIYPHSHTHTNR